MARLKDVLTGEELDDYNAALQRRPVVANSFTFAMNLNEAANASANKRVASCRRR